MMTNLIAATSSAPSLRERAMQEFARIEAAHDADERRRREHEQRREADNLAYFLAEHLGLTEPDYYIVIPPPDGGAPVVAHCDDLSFSVRRDHDTDIVSLHVAVPCGRGCGEDVWVTVRDLRGLAMAVGGEHYHDHQCVGWPARREPTAARVARAAIDDVTAAAERLAAAVRHVQELEDARPSAKSAAIRRLMQALNEETQKPHSASSAEKIVETDAEYATYRRQQADAEVERQRAYGAYEAAKLRARLDVVLAAAEDAP